MVFLYFLLFAALKTHLLVENNQPEYSQRQGDEKHYYHKYAVYFEL